MTAHSTYLSLIARGQLVDHAQDLFTIHIADLFRCAENLLNLLRLEDIEDISCEIRSKRENRDRGFSNAGIQVVWSGTWLRHGFLQC